jgi:hypothetical protein
MMILPLHGTLDHHDAVAVVVFALTLALGSFLGSLRRRRGAEVASTEPCGDGESAPVLGEGEDEG